VRALTPHVGAYVELPDGERLGVRRARATDEAVPHGRLSASDDRLLLGAAGGALELLEVHPPGRRPMDAAAYLRGHAAEISSP
jgi:methionyl-tRNA formyltransferase